MNNSENKLHDILREEIEREGFISLGDYMALTLGHPQYGYYMTRDPFGAAGDFTTAPEISQMFGEVIGAWVIDTWSKLKAPAFNLIEIGPGRGTLMSDIMRVGKAMPEFWEKAQIHLVETSPILRQKQKETLSTHHVQWHEDLETVPTDKTSIILGNEFLDALPVQQLKRTSDGWQKKVVTYKPKTSSFAFDWMDAAKGLLNYLPRKTISNEIYEVSTARIEFIKSSGCGTTPCVTQSVFLRNLGIEYRAQALTKNASGQQREDIAKVLARLIGASQMGELFKVMCLHHGMENAPEGFGK